jgi:uncharacterized protein YcaQ
VIGPDDLRRFAVLRTFSTPATLARAIDTLGFVQADPIRAPARAQDLTLRHRVEGYRAGDLERQYPSLAVEEDFFVNYGFVTRALQSLMHPRSGFPRWTATQRQRADALLAFVREHGAVHPRRADRHFSHGTVTNYWGGSSSATTHLLEALHYRGLLRVLRRDDGIRVYAVHEQGAGPQDRPARLAALDALVDTAVRKYAPLPSATLSFLINRLQYAAPQWRRELKGAVARAKRRLAHAKVDGVEYYWPPAEQPPRDEVPARVRLLAPFDPLVWDRRRFELLWGWAYRFEAYTPAPKRKFGYYALPLLWRDRVVGWANTSLADGGVSVALGYVSRRPRETAFRQALEAEVEALRSFL